MNKVQLHHRRPGAIGSRTMFSCHRLFTEILERNNNSITQIYFNNYLFIVSLHRQQLS